MPRHLTKQTFVWLSIILVILAFVFWFISHHFWLQTLPPFKSVSDTAPEGNSFAIWRQEQFRTYCLIASGVAAVFTAAIFDVNSWVRNIAKGYGALTVIILLCIIAWIVYSVVYVTQHGNMFWEAWFRLPLTYREFPVILGILVGLWGTSLISRKAQNV